MLKGYFYNTRDKELLEIYTKVRNLMDKFNNTREDNKIIVLKELLGNIDEGVYILPGVNIGENVVIGAGSVVAKSIPSNYIAVGNPCRIIRETGD